MSDTNTPLELVEASRPSARAFPGRAPSRLFEMLVPYTDPSEARDRGRPAGTFFTLTFQVWATDVERASAYARECFHDHRLLNPRARMALDGPIPLRIVPGTDEHHGT